MAHQHAQAHIVRRQRGRDDDDEDPRVVTFISVEVVTEDPETRRVVVTQSPEPQRTLVAPAVRSRTSTTREEEPEETTTTRAAATSRKPSTTQQSDAEETERSSIKQASTLMVATKQPTPSAAGAATAGIASATAAVSSASASSAASGSEEGMSGGAKAGIALGILLVVCAILTGVLLLYRRKKKQIAAANPENEKIGLYNAPPPLPPQVQAAAPPAPSIRTNRTMSTAPRLSLRPVTQFDPTFNEQRKSGGNLLNVAAAGGAVAQMHNRGPSPDRPSSAWERPDASSAPAANPFNDPTQSGPPSANPFGNESALDARHAEIPNSPPNASPMHSTQPSKDFANPAAAIAAGDIDPVVMAGAMASIPATDDFPVPPPKNVNSASVPPSPAWTEDLPASPGPAPMGPPPVAGAMAGSRPQSPAAGPDNVHRVQLDFKPSMQDELDLHAGQLVRMLHEYDDGWVSSIWVRQSARKLILIFHRPFVSVWTELSKVLCPVLVSPSTPSSLVMVHPVKVHHPQACVDLLFARPWVPVAFLSLVRSLQLADAIHLTLRKCLPVTVACPLVLAQ